MYLKVSGHISYKSLSLVILYKINNKIFLKNSESKFYLNSLKNLLKRKLVEILISRTIIGSCKLINWAIHVDMFKDYCSWLKFQI